MAGFDYWDPQGQSGGNPYTGSMSGTWEGNSWSTSTGGASNPTTWTEGNAAGFAVHAGSGTPAFTVTMGSNHTVAGFFDGYNVGAATVTIAGTGSIVLPASTVQGFYMGGDSVTFNVPISGSGATLAAENVGTMYLNAANTYSGGTELGYGSGSTSWTGTIYFSNNAAFGSGPITLAHGTGSTIAGEGNGSFNIPNAVYLANLGLNLTGTTGGVTFSGAWDTGTSGTCTLGISSLVIISGPISDTQGLSKSGLGTLVLSGNNNTYGSSGSTTISQGTLLLANTSGSATGATAISVGNSSATLTGSGIASGAVTTTGNISATNLSGGTATLSTGPITWGLGSSYLWALNNATGNAGTSSGWDQVVANGGITISANSSNPLNLDVISLTAGNTQGALASFDNTRDYSWVIMHSTTPPIAGFATSAFAVNTSAFANALGTAVFAVSTNITGTGGDVSVNFVHPPILAVSNVAVMAGSNAIFFASNTVVGSIPATATWSWKSNNVALSDNGRVSGSATPTLTILNAQTTDDATYTVLASNAAGSAFLSATLTVTAASTQVTWTNAVPITYGTALDTNELDASANVPGSFVYTPSAGTVLNAGTNTLTAVFTPTDMVDYTRATNTVTLVVMPAPLTVTASNATRPLNTTNPTFSGVIAGLVNGDNITATYSSPATQGSPAGTYPINPTLVDPNNRAGNYSVTLVPGNLYVGTVVTWPTPTAITYGTGLSSNQLDATASTAGTFAYSPAAGTVLSVGNYTLSVVFTPSDTADYTSATNSVNLTVNPAPLTVTAANAMRQAGSSNPLLTGTIVGLTNNDNITANYSTTANQSSAPGTYPITPQLVDPNNRATNYTVNLVNGTLTVIAPPAPITASAPALIPLPVSIQTNAGTFILCPSQPSTPAPGQAQMKILVDASSLQTGQYLAAALFKSTGYQFQIVQSTATNAVRYGILITTSNALTSLGAEGYQLNVLPDSAVIRAPQQAGAFYGVQTLLQLLPPQIYSLTIVTNVAWVAPCVTVQDYPLYSWRGVMLDVARHFVNKQNVKQILDAMAMHKLNTFHWHLVDDQGFRLQITNYPNLTIQGCWRNGIDYGLPPRATAETNASGQYGGFYTQADAKEIVAYAAERHITVVPEIEMPCHSDAGLYAYSQFSTGESQANYTMDYYGIQSLYGIDLYSLGAPGTLAFLQDILAETMAIFPSKYIHVGGDEVIASGDTHWTTYSSDVTNFNHIFGRNPNSGSTSDIELYQYWLSTNLSAFCQARGRTMIGWSEIEASSVVPNAAVMDWMTGGTGVTVAEAGLPVVECPDNTCYINYVEGSSVNYSNEPPFVVGGTPSYLSLSTVYNFNPMPASLPAQYQSNILGAQCNLWGEYVPSFRNYMFKMFPRETAMAEITWTPKAQQVYSSFTNRLVTQEQRFTQMGLNYDHEAIPKIGGWTNIPTTGLTVTNIITPFVNAAGEIDINFWYNSGNNLAISSVALLVNGVQVDIDTHAGLAEPSSSYQATEPFIPVFTLYVLHLPNYVPGAIYSVVSTIAGSGGSTQTGTIYMPNWN